jgi:ubiquinone/menaquinone biosynthesis C-methylase UbiE
MVWYMAHGDEHSSQPSGEFPPLFHAAAEDDQSVAQMVALLDYQDALPSARRLHDWAIETAGVQPGENVVDLGSGTGTMSLHLASLVVPVASAGLPTGQVIGVEPNPHLRAVAVSRARAAGVSNVSFIEGFAGALPFDDSTIDFVWCERVLQHLAEPQSAINDIARVLRPGGRAVLLDSDYGTRIVSDLDPDLAAAFNRASLGSIANPYAARNIPAQIHAARLEPEPDAGSSAFVFSSEMLLRTQVLSRDADDAVESGGLTRQVADAAVRAVHDAAERGLAFAAITVFGFVARKPMA